MKSDLLFIPAFILLLASCGNSNTANNNNGPIILGDTATIVTERDSQYLKDDMQDWEPKKAAATAEPEAKPTTEATPAKVETPAPAAKELVKENIASGYVISFGNIKIVFEGITANDASRQNPEKQDGLSYIVKTGDIERSKIHIYGVKDASVKQRYQSRLTLHSNLGTVDLRNLGLYMSGWKNVPNTKSGGQATFSLSDLNNIDFSSVNNNKIKNATDRELRNRRTNRKVIESWMKEISRTRSADDKPCEVILDNVQLQISGTGADGKAFRKNIRMSV